MAVIPAGNEGAGRDGGCSRCRHFFVVKSGAGAYGTVQVNFTKEEVRK